MNSASQPFGTLLLDLRYGVRQLRRNPGFTTVVIITLALGIGANSAIFSMANGIILRGLPYDQSQYLYVINEVVPQWTHFAPVLPVNSGNFLLWQRECREFSAMALVLPMKYILMAQGNPRQVSAASVSPSFFSMLSGSPQLGRAFAPQSQSAPDHEVILTTAFWRRVFNADPQIIGKAVTLNDVPHTIVGVLPESFRPPEVLSSVPDLFTPIALSGDDLQPGVTNFNYTVIAKMRPDANPAQAVAQLNVIEARIARRADADLKAMLTPLKEVIIGPAANMIWMLTIAAIFVLLIICVNLANLMLVRNTRRTHEVAIRAALGGTVTRLMRQFLTEGFILACAGGGLGLLFAAWGLQLLIRNAPLGIPRVEAIRIDSRVLLFTLCASVTATLLFSFLPALRLTKVGSASDLKSSGRSLSHGKLSARLRGGLVIGETALCVVLLTSALLLVKSLVQVTHANRWMDEHRVFDLSLSMPPLGARTVAERYRFYSDVLRRVRELPGVIGAGFANKLPLQGPSWGDDVDFREERQSSDKREVANFYFVSPDYFRAIGLPLIRGRLFSESDQGKDVVLISESVAQKLLPGRNPIGTHLLWPRDQERQREVIGVIGDVRTAADKLPSLGVYVPFWSFNQLNESLVVRADMDDPRVAVEEIRRAIWGINPEVAISPEKTLRTIFDSSNALRKYETSIAALFAACAVLLAALGLYGVISQSVSHRTHEIGIRMALGAQKADVLRLTVGHGMILEVIGLATGLILASGLTRFLSNLLYGVKPTDPLTFALVSIISLAVSLVASYIPAQRAANVHPTVALRYE